MATQVSIDEKKKTLTIVLDLQEPERSASGKTMVIATTRGNQTTEARFQGRPITVGVNAYYKP